MFGDFYSGAFASVVVAPSMPLVFDFDQKGIPNGGIMPSVFMTNVPVDFQGIVGILDNPINGGVPIPAMGTTTFTTVLDEGAIGPIGVGSMLALRPPDQMYQDDLNKAAVGIFGPGAATFVDGSATVTFEDGDMMVSDRDTFAISQNFTFDTTPVTIGGVPTGSAVRQIKIAENTSPQPRSRLYFNYNFFNDVIGGFGDVNRYLFGFEHPFGDNIASIDLRIPFAGTLSSNQVGGGALLRDTEFGNIAVTFKGVLFRNQQTLFSAGCGVTIPTSDDTRVMMPGGGQILGIDNDSVHLQPFVAVLLTPTDQTFLQCFVQCDVDVNGNGVRGDANGLSPTFIGVYQDQTLLFVDLSIGHWLFEDPTARFLRGIAPIFELHYTTTTQDSDTVVGNGLTIASAINCFDVLNATGGAVFVFPGNASVRLAVSAPLRQDDDRHFTVEGGAQVNIPF
jgi:hypothetical protein